MATSFTTLTADKNTDGSIKNFVNDSTVPSATMLDMAEDWIYRRLRVREMLKTETGTMTQDSDTIAAPADYISPRLFMITGTEKVILEHRILEDVEGAFTYDSDDNRVSAKPRFYTVNATNIQLDAPALEAYPYHLTYFARLAALGAGNPTNFLTSAPRLLNAVCIAFAYEYIKQVEDMKYWLAVATNELMEMIAVYDAEVGRDLHLAVRPE